MAVGGPTLTLSGVTWTSTFDVPCNMIIELEAGTTNRINGTSGINLNGHNLTITGTGSLEINSSAQSGEAAGIYSSGLGNIAIGGGVTVTITSGTYGIKTQGEFEVGQDEYTGGPQVTLNITGNTAGVKADSVTIYNERVTIGCSGSGVGTRGVITGGLLSKRAITTITGGEAGIQLADADNHKVSCNEGNLKISGTANAIIGATELVFSEISNDAFITAGESEGTAVEKTLSDPSNPLDEKFINIHFHSDSKSFAGSADGITATCSVAGCKGAQLFIEVGDKEYDNQPVSPILTGLTEFNAFTGLSLSETNVKYYKVETENATTGGELQAEIPKQPGFYYASITAGSASAVMAFKIEAVKPELTTVTATAITYGQTLANSTVSGNATYNGEAIEGTWAFTNGTVAPSVSDSDTTSYEVTFTPDDNNIPSATTNITLTVNKASTTVTGAAPSTVPFSATYDLTGLFTISNNEVTASYSIVTGSTGIGTISNGNTLNVTSCGQFIIKCTTTESENYASGTDNATITISKANITPTVTMAGFSYGDAPTTPSVTDNTGNGEVTYTYWKNEDCDEATTTADGATGNNKMPKKAGTYWVQADIATTGTTNEGTCKASFTIAPGVLKPEMIGVEQAEFFHDGTAKSPSIIVFSEGLGMLQKDVDYTISGDASKTEVGTYSITVTGTGSFSGTVTVNWCIIKEDAIVLESPEIGTGAPQAEIKGLSGRSLMVIFLDEDDYNQLASSTADFKIKLSVDSINNTISSASKALFQAAAGDYVFGPYLDIKIKTQLNGGAETTVTTTNRKVELLVTLDNSLINTDDTMDRIYKVARNHGGVVELLDATFDPVSKQLSFKTDKFSEYAIVYKDSPKSGGTGQGGTQTTGGNAESNGDSNETTKDGTKTGDVSKTPVWIVIMAEAMGIILVMLIFKRKINKA